MKRESWKKLWPFMKAEQQPTADLRIVGDLTVLRSKIIDDAEADYSWRTDPELALYGRYVVSKRLEQEGFEFEQPQLKTALQDL